MPTGIFLLDVFITDTMWRCYHFLYTTLSKGQWMPKRGVKKYFRTFWSCSLNFFLIMENIRTLSWYRLSGAMPELNQNFQNNSKILKHRHPTIVLKILNYVTCHKINDCEANIVDPDQTAPQEQSDLDQQCLLKGFSPNTQSYNGNQTTTHIFFHAFFHRYL